MSVSMWVVILGAGCASVALGTRVGRLQADDRRARRPGAGADRETLDTARRAEARDAIGSSVVACAFVLFAAAVGAIESPAPRWLLAVVASVTVVSTTVAVAAMAHRRPGNPR